MRSEPYVSSREHRREGASPSWREEASAESLRQEVESLRRRVKELEGTTVADSDTTDGLKARSAALAERVKELKCLYSISSLLKGRH